MQQAEEAAAEREALSAALEEPPNLFCAQLRTENVLRLALCLDAASSFAQRGLWRCRRCCCLRRPVRPLTQTVLFTALAGCVWLLTTDDSLPGTLCGWAVDSVAWLNVSSGAAAAEQVLTGTCDVWNRTPRYVSQYTQH
eukprot:871096-Prymnesium_polylepis.1